MIGDVEQEQDWERLGKLVVAARVAHGMYTREQLAKAADFSTRFLGDIEKARRANYDPSYLARLEQALGWATGSIDDILDGGEPTIRQPAEAPERARRIELPHPLPSDEAIARVMQNPRVPESEKPRIVQILIEDREREQQRRLALAESLIRDYEQTG